MPQISVIVPVYKVEPYLRRCVDSILAQTFTDFEVILVDDGSPDRSGVICDEYAAKDSRVYVIHQENGGLSVARNAGLDWIFANSSSEWITFVDSDDWIHPKMLEWMENIVHSNGVEVCVCRYERINGYNGFAKLEDIACRLISPEELYVENVANAVVACGKLYSKEKWKSLRFPKGKLHEDVYTIHRVLFSEKIVSVIDEPLYQYYVNPNGITGSVSDKKLIDELEGQRLRAAYFREHGFKKAYLFELHSTGYLANEWNAMQRGLIPFDREYRKELSRRFRKAIQREHISFKEKKWVYECAYPNLMKVYWMLVAIGRKIGFKV